MTNDIMGGLVDSIFVCNAIMSNYKILMRLNVLKHLQTVYKFLISSYKCLIILY